MLKTHALKVGAEDLSQAVMQTWSPESVRTDDGIKGSISGTSHLPIVKKCYGFVEH